MSKVSREELGATAVAMVKFIKTGERPVEPPNKQVVDVIRHRIRNIRGLEYLAHMLGRPVNN